MFYYRDGIDVAKYIFANPVFANHMMYDPVREWTDATQSERVYSEFMTGDYAWEIQVSRFELYFIMCLTANRTSCPRALLSCLSSSHLTKPPSHHIQVV